MDAMPIVPRVWTPQVVCSHKLTPAQDVWSLAKHSFRFTQVFWSRRVASPYTYVLIAKDDASTQPAVRAMQHTRLLRDMCGRPF